ncbi:MAG: OB-fold domain-containing protein [Chloroflexi bacterium]|nr:OB-fold domain-containing protein [Chloroflexota bacterium]
MVIPVVDLEAGGRMMSNLVDVEPDPAKIVCDMPVEVGMIDEAVASGVRAGR